MKNIMEKYKSFLIFTLIYILTIIGDFVTTYMYTPDLSMEANPLVTLLNADWKGLLLSNTIGLAFFMLMAYFPFVYYKRRFIECTNFKEYVSMLHFERPDQFTKILIKNTKNKLFIMAPIGYAWVCSNIVTRLCQDISNVLAIYNSYPCLFCFLKIPHTVCNMIYLHTDNGVIMIPVVMIAVYLLTITSALYFWYVKEYNINKKALQSQNLC